MAVLSKRPYLIRALNDWIVDSDLTPYLMVDATGDEVQVPDEFVNDGRIVLNISPGAVRDLLLADDAVSFSARFSGRPFSVHVPVGQILAIYARENGEGMMFDSGDSAQSGESGDANKGEHPDTDGTGANSGDDHPSPDGSGKPGGHLKLV